MTNLFTTGIAACGIIVCDRLVAAGDMQFYVGVAFIAACGWLFTSSISAWLKGRNHG